MNILWLDAVIADGVGSWLEVAERGQANCGKTEKGQKGSMTSYIFLEKPWQDWHRKENNGVKEGLCPAVGLKESSMVMIFWP